MSDEFEFDHPGNVVYCEREFSPIQHRLTLSTVEEFVHTSLDRYAFIAVTAFSSTLDGLFKIVQSENQRQQQLMDETSSHFWRDLNVGTITIINSVQ